MANRKAKILASKVCNFFGQKFNHKRITIAGIKWSNSTHNKSKLINSR